MNEASGNDGRTSPAEMEADVAARRRELERFSQFGGGEVPLRLRDGLRVEEVGEELVVLDASGEALHRVTGSGVEAVRLLEGGVTSAAIPPHLLDATEALAEAGLVSGPHRFSRRKLIAAGGATWAAAMVTSFVLANPAAAWSSCKNGKTPTQNDSGSNGKKYTTAGTYTWTSGPSGNIGNTQESYTKLVRAWGGGGGGGDDGWTLGGGGGGGGAYVDATITILECTDYTVIVGAGGAAKNDGSDSKFDTTVIAAAGKKGIDAAAFESGDGGAGGAIANSAPAGGNRRAGGNGGTGGSYSNTACGGGSGGSTGNGGNGSASSAGAGGTGSPSGAAGGIESTAGSAPGGGGGRCRGGRSRWSGMDRRLAACLVGTAHEPPTFARFAL